jgi:2-dehydropantoate 2-reductase
MVMQMPEAPRSRIAVIGAGAVGIGLFCALRAAGKKCDLITRDDGLRVFSLQTLTCLHSFENAPLPKTLYEGVISTVKRYDTDAAGPICRQKLAPGGWLLTVQNGLDIDLDYASYVPTESIVRATLNTCVERVTDETAVLKSDSMRLVLAAGERARVAAACIATPDIVVHLTAEFTRESWRKLIVSASLSAVCAYGAVNAGRLSGRNDLIDLLKHALQEGIDLYALLYGDNIGVTAEGLLDNLKYYPADFSPSLKLDRARGKRTELDWLTGRLLKEGERAGVDLPTHAFLYAQLKL